MINQQPNTHRPAPSGGMTELVLTHNAPDQTQLLLPMLAHLSHTQCGRWLTWISQGPVDRQLLERYGVDLRCLRVIHVPEADNHRWVLWEALVRGNSHTVIASPGPLGEREFRQLEAAAVRGESQGLLLRLRS